MWLTTPYVSSINPATETVFALVPNSDCQDVADAVRAAAGAFPAWSRLGYETRAKYLLKIADMIDQNLEELALAESRDQGKPVSLARNMDIPRASLNFRKGRFQKKKKNILHPFKTKNGLNFWNDEWYQSLFKTSRQFAYAWQGLVETAASQETPAVVNISSRAPLGVAGLISPWNLPLYLLTFKIAPAIMAGEDNVNLPSQ